MLPFVPQKGGFAFSCLLGRSQVQGDLGFSGAAPAMSQAWALPGNGPSPQAARVPRDTQGGIVGVSVQG